MVSIASLKAVQTARPDTHSFGRSLKSSAMNERVRIQSSVGSVMGMIAAIGDSNEGMNLGQGLPGSCFNVMHHATRNIDSPLSGFTALGYAVQCWPDALSKCSRSCNSAKKSELTPGLVLYTY